jgi:hypothetical protein
MKLFITFLFTSVSCAFAQHESVKCFQIKDCKTNQGINNIMVYTSDFKFYTFTDKLGYFEFDYSEASSDLNICIKSINVETYCVLLSDLVDKSVICYTPNIFLLDSVKIIDYKLSNQNIVKKAIQNYKNTELVNDTFNYRFNYLELKNKNEVKNVTSNISLCVGKTFNFLNEVPVFFSNYSEISTSDFFVSNNFKYLETTLYPLNFNESLLSRKLLNMSENWNKEIIQDSLGQYIRFYLIENDKIVFDCLIDIFTYNLHYFRFSIRSKHLIKVTEDYYDWETALVWDVYFDKSNPKIPETLFFSALTYLQMDNGNTEVRKSMTQFVKSDLDYLPKNSTKLKLKY